MAVTARRDGRVEAAFMAFVEAVGSTSDVRYLNATLIKAENKRL